MCESKSLEQMQNEVLQVNINNGWYEGDRRFGEDVALLHSEVSEMLEAYRDHGFDDMTRKHVLISSCTDPQHGDSTWDHECDDVYGPGKPEGVGSEAADILIRLLDTCERSGIILSEEYERKITYNKTRGYRHGGKNL